jgi:hypothetical protein
LDFETDAGAKLAVSKLNDTTLQGCKIKVSFAAPTLNPKLKTEPNPHTPIELGTVSARRHEILVELRFL